MTTPRQRIMPTGQQVAYARALLDAIPREHRFDWDSPAGQKFVGWLADTNTGGVPVTWLADALGINPGQLYNLLAKQKGAA
jgi:hypothetical protein